MNYKLLLADDDEDDCAFFKEALDDLLFSVPLVTVHDGIQLMEFLLERTFPHLPDLIFLDLNMPRKGGAECLTEIKSIDKLKHVPVIIFSTSHDKNTANFLYEKGAIYYVRKPGEFYKLKKVIGEVLTKALESNFKQPAREHFILEA